MTIQSKLFAIQSELHKIDKNGVNNFNKYSYVMLGDILDKIRPHLNKHGLTITQSVDHINSEFINTEKAYYTVSTCLCTTTLCDVETGEKIVNTCPGYSADKQGDKSMYKAITGARKYSLSTLFCLDWDSKEPEDDSDDYQPTTTRSSGGFKRSKVF